MNDTKNVPVGTSSACYGSYGWLVEQYRQTPRFLSLKASSHKTQNAALERFRVEHGHRQASDMKRVHVEFLMARMAATPAAANALMKLIKKLSRYAITRDIIKTDPTLGIEQFPENPDGYHTWTAAEIEQFRAHHGAGSKATLAMLLLYYSGGTRADLAKFGWGNISGGTFRYRRQKTGMSVDLPIHDDLRGALDQAERDTLLFITHGKGRAYQATTIGNWFSEQCNAAGLTHCTSHGVRKAGATYAAEHGATEWEIMAYLGHKTPDEARTYVKSADRGRLGAAAMAKIGMANPVVGFAKRAGNTLKEKGN